jgi:hypothetical protein
MADSLRARIGQITMGLRTVPRVFGRAELRDALKFLSKEERKY